MTNTCVGGIEVYLHSFRTLALYGGEWSTSGPGRFSPGKEHIQEKAGWASELLWTFRRRQKSNPFARIESLFIYIILCITADFVIDN
jgi:hypothetical protein